MVIIRGYINSIDDIYDQSIHHPMAVLILTGARLSTTTIDATG
jgi:hypothetical protein